MNRVEIPTISGIINKMYKIHQIFGPSWIKQEKVSANILDVLKQCHLELEIYHVKKFYAKKHRKAFYGKNAWQKNYKKS